MPHETGFSTADNPYTESEFFKICEDYGVTNDPVKYRDEKFYWTYQCGIGWPNDYIGPDSMLGCTEYQRVSSIRIFNSKFSGLREIW